MLQKMTLLETMRVFCPFGLLLFCLFIQSDFAQNQTAPEIVSLESNKSLEREFADGDDKHVYRISLTANQYLFVTIEQRGVDVTASLLGDEGDEKPIAQFDTDMRPQGVEKIEFIAKNSGNYRLIVAPKYKNIIAGKYEIRLIERRQFTESDRLRQDARDLAANSLRLYQARKYDDASAETDRALAAFEKSGDTKSFLYVLTLKRKGLIFFDKGEYATAEDYFTRAAKASEDGFGATDARTSDTINNLAVLYNVTGSYDKSEQIFERILINQEKIFGENHPAITAILNNFGNLCRRKGDYAKAEKLHLRSLAIREKVFGHDAPEVMNALAGLATVYYEKKDFLKVKETDERALKIAEKSFAPDDPKLMMFINNVALANTELGDYAKAEPLFKRALLLSEKIDGENGIVVAEPLNNLGELYAYIGDYDKSNSFYERSLKILEKSLSPDHPKIALVLGNIAANYLFRGEYAKAEPLLQRQLVIREISLGSNHPDVAKTLNNLARLYENEGDATRALNYQTRVDKLLEQYNSLNLYAGSERQQLAYFDYLGQQTDQLFSMQSRFPDNYEMRKLAVTAVLQRKGRVQDILTDSLVTLRQRFDPKDQKLLNDLSETNSQLSKFVTDGQQKLNETERREKIKTLTEQKEKLETEISFLSAGFYKNQSGITLDAVAASVPSDAALLEFIVYHPFQLRAINAKNQYEKPRYAVFIIRQKGDVIFKDLGDALQIDDSINAFRQALRDPKRKDVQQLARAVDEKIVSPIRALLGDAKQLLVSSDGALNLIPFEALVDEQNHYLIENYSFTYLTSGRDLLRMQTARTSKSKSLLIANPQFGESVAEQTVFINPPRTKSRAKRRNSKTVARNMTDTYFAPLGGTLQEAQLIQNLFPDALFLNGTKATETALKQANAPEILHIATHGFFLEDANSANGENIAATREAKINLESENPLLRSGLALAGANRHDAYNKDDGILTALEASGLNLWGTKLVVLSACDTGLGEIKNGEGVYGLRRSFVLAGAESLVMSLWSVSDYVTRETMVDYYKNLKAGTGRGESLRQVKLEFLKRKGRAHPFYWAAFIQSGEWANLDGKR